MSLNDFASINGTNSTVSESYTVLYSSATTYKVNMTLTEDGYPSVNFTAWVLTNGTAFAVDLSGQNMTGQQAADNYPLLALGFSEEMGVASQAISGAYSPYLHETTSGTATFGPTTMNVVNYAAASLPFTVSACGETETFTAYSLQIGSATSGSQPILTDFTNALSSEGPLGAASEYVTIQLVSVTLA